MSTITLIRNKANTLAQVQALVAGTQKYFPNGSFTLGNTAYTTASIVQALTSLEDAVTAVNTVQASARDAVSARRAAEAKVAPLLRDCRNFLRTTFGTAAAPLVDFGMPPPKARTPLGSEQRLAATAKMRATRLARGTTSKKQKLAIKGDVTGVLVTPVSHAGPSSPPTAAPAGPASVATAPGGASK